MSRLFGEVPMVTRTAAGKGLKPAQKVAVGDVNAFIFPLSGVVERTCLGSKE